MGKQTLKGVLTRFVIVELFYSVAVVFLLFLLINTLINVNFVYPANYSESQLSTVEHKIKNESVMIQDIPTIYKIQIEDKTGNVLDSTISKKEKRYIEQAKENGRSQTNSLIGSKSFVYFEGKSQNIILSYQVAADFTSSKLRRMLPNAEILSLILFLLLWLVGFVLIIRHFAYQLQKELVKVKQVNEQIRQMNLDFASPQSNILEIDQLIASLDIMKNELSDSLQEQWAAQHQQQNILQAITHDIRTPITLISGNLELLEETVLSEEQEELMTSAKKGLMRLNQYVEELKGLSGLSLAGNEKQNITINLLSEWISLAESLALRKKIQIDVNKKECSSLLIQKEEVTKAFQNIIQNAVDYSPQNSKIFISFENVGKSYQIIVLDSGNGFEEEALRKATNRFWTTSPDRGNGHYGLGLTIADEMMKKNHGAMELSNEKKDNNIIGGKVKLILEKE